MAIRQGKTAGIPFRQQLTPKPLTLAANLLLPEVVAIVARRIENISRARACCAFVFVRAGEVYVLSEERVIAHRWAVEHTDEWVGCYGGMVDQERLQQDMAGML